MGLIIPFERRLFGTCTGDVLMVCSVPTHVSPTIWISSPSEWPSFSPWLEPSASFRTSSSSSESDITSVRRLGFFAGASLTGGTGINLFAADLVKGLRPVFWWFTIAANLGDGRAKGSRVLISGQCFTVLACLAVYKLIFSPHSL